MHGGRADRPPIPHAAGAGRGDDVVKLLDRVEHPRHIGHPQPIQPDVTQVGGEVQADVRLIRAPGGGVDLPLAPQELLHPFGDGDGGVEVLAGADLAPDLFHRGKGLGVLEHGQHQLGDLPLDVRVFIQRQQGAGVLQFGLDLLQRGKTAPSQRVAPPPVRVRGQLELVGPAAVGAAPPLPTARAAQLRAGLAQFLADRLIPAGTRLEGGSVHRRCRTFPCSLTSRHRLLGVASLRRSPAPAPPPSAVGTVRPVQDATGGAGGIAYPAHHRGVAVRRPGAGGCRAPGPEGGPVGPHRPVMGAAAGTCGPPAGPGRSVSTPTSTTHVKRYPLVACPRPHSGQARASGYVPQPENASLTHKGPALITWRPPHLA